MRFIKLISQFWHDTVGSVLYFSDQEREISLPLPGGRPCCHGTTVTVTT